MGFSNKATVWGKSGKRGARISIMSKRESTKQPRKCPTRGLVSPFLSQSLSIPTLASLREGVFASDLLQQAHSDHVLNHTKELVI